MVLGKTPENTYKIGVKTGILKGTFMRNAFAVCPRKHIAPDDVPTKSVSIREATKMLPGGGQGIFHCDYKQSSLQCSSRRCKCKKITEFASVIVIIVQNILLFLQEQIRKYLTIFLRQDFVRQDFFRIFLEYNDNFFID